MVNRLKLHVPSFKELEYRQRILAQPDTMSYNKGYELGFDNYNNETGCINFTKDSLRGWYDWWIANEPDRYYAYLVRIKDNQPIGNVSFHFDEDSNEYGMEIVIEAKFRKKGYCVEGLKLLTAKAFVDLNINKLRNDIPIERKAAIAGHKKAGFKEIEIINGKCILELDKQNYFNLTK